MMFALKIILEIVVGFIIGIVAAKLAKRVHKLLNFLFFFFFAMALSMFFGGVVDFPHSYCLLWTFIFAYLAFVIYFEWRGQRFPPQ